jgi:hypothetical protein
LEDIMAEHIPVEHLGPEPVPMYDRNGYQLKIGDHIVFDGGKGRIVDYLGAGNSRSGVLVRVITSTRQMVDLALLLARAECSNYREHQRPETKERHVAPSRYGM